MHESAYYTWANIVCTSKHSVPERCWQLLKNYTQANIVCTSKHGVPEKCWQLLKNTERVLTPKESDTTWVSCARNYNAEAWRDTGWFTLIIMHSLLMWMIGLARTKQLKQATCLRNFKELPAKMPYICCSCLVLAISTTSTRYTQCKVTLVRAAFVRWWCLQARYGTCLGLAKPYTMY